jgi:hypothetical protein
MKTGAIVVGIVGDEVAIKEGTFVGMVEAVGRRVTGEEVGESAVGVIVDGATVATVGRRVTGEEVGELESVGAIVRGTTGLSVGLKIGETLVGGVGVDVVKVKMKRGKTSTDEVEKDIF